MRHARKRGLAGLAVLGITVVAGLLAAWGVSPGETSQIAPADVVALRFPADWMNSDETTGTAQAEVPAAAPASFQLASAGDTRLDTGLMFSPAPDLREHRCSRWRRRAARSRRAAVKAEPRSSPSPGRSRGRDQA